MKKNPLIQSTQNRYTLDSDCASSSYTQSNKGYQINFLSPQASRSKLKHFQSIPPSQHKYKYQKSSLEINYKQNILEKSEDLSNQNQGTFQSMINIKVTNPGEASLDQSNRRIDVSHNPNFSSSKNLISNHHIKTTELHKSGTEPFITSMKQCQGFYIKTNLVNDQMNFKKNKNQSKPSDKNKTISYLNVTDPNKTINNDKKLMASRVINESRITLKDYMFMANTSSKKAAQIKRTQLNQSRKAIKTQPSMQPTPKPNVIIHKIHEKYNKQKYHISNDQMGNVLKASIKEEILNLNGKIKDIEHWMQKHNKIRSQQLILLYTMRTDLQEYNKKFNQSIARLTSDDNQQFVNIIYSKGSQDSDRQSQKSQIYQLSQI